MGSHQDRWWPVDASAVKSEGVVDDCRLKAQRFSSTWKPIRPTRKRARSTITTIYPPVPYISYRAYYLNRIPVLLDICATQLVYRGASDNGLLSEQTFLQLYVQHTNSPLAPNPLVQMSCGWVPSSIQVSVTSLIGWVY